MTPLEEMLVRKGVDELAASQWAKFLAIAFDTLRLAEARVMEPDVWQAHIACQGALLRPRREAAERNRRLPSEEGLTCALAQALWAIRVTVPVNHPLRVLEIQFHSEARMPSRRRTGQHARRSDIWIKSALTQQAPAIVMEAKLIVSDAELRDAYFGLGGIGCFTEGPDPHSKGPVGGLIAYTVEDGDETWLARIGAAMAARPGLTASDVAVLPGERGAPDLWSEAERPNLGIAEPIGIAHLVMRFAAAPV